VQAVSIILPSISKDDDAKRLVGRGKHPVLIEISFVVKSIYNALLCCKDKCMKLQQHHGFEEMRPSVLLLF
jgi:hypothetical protein